MLTEWTYQACSITSGSPVHVRVVQIGKRWATREDLLRRRVFWTARKCCGPRGASLRGRIQNFGQNTHMFLA
jgi:hypothetical protein